MGLAPFSNSSSSSSYCPTSNTTPNPNRYVFTIEEKLEGEKFDLYIVNYPHATTFKGKKVIVVKKGTVITDEFDPHFFENGNIIARFKPTVQGIALAKEFI
jgi:hypothetical protein